MDKSKRYIEHSGNRLLNTPILNKGNAFSMEERQQFNLLGLIPKTVETIEEQETRAYQQYSSFTSTIDKHVYLRNIQDTNETLYYKLIGSHIEEMMPIVYTPTVGEACQNFSHIYRRNRGIFLCYDDKEHLDDIVNNVPKANVQVIVITDGERILGLGDQGVGGMGIPIGKLALYTACGGINPENALPVVIDVGTNRAELLSDPMYMGWRNPRIRGEAYYEFVDKCLKALLNRWPDALIQFEDFAQPNAMPLLERYQDKLCCFNDDIQGTAAVTVGTLLASANAQGKKLSDNTVVFAGAGSAGCGIAEAIISQMIIEGISEQEARTKVFMVDRWGLLENNMTSLLSFQKPLAQDVSIRDEWGMQEVAQITLMDVISHAKPDILIGVTGVSGLFTEEVIKTMYKHCPRPTVLPLSNPTSQVEATPQNIIEWTEGNAIVATGSPFAPVSYDGNLYPIAQCNNSYIFPSIGLGVLSCGATRITDNMLMVSSQALADLSPMLKGKAKLLPSLSNIQEVSRYIALQVAKQAVEDGVALPHTEKHILNKMEDQFWYPEYRQYKRTSYF